MGCGLGELFLNHYMKTISKEMSKNMQRLFLKYLSEYRLHSFGFPHLLCSFFINELLSVCLSVCLIVCLPHCLFDCLDFCAAGSSW